MTRPNQLVLSILRNTKLAGARTNFNQKNQKEEPAIKARRLAFRSIKVKSPCWWRSLPTRKRADCSTTRIFDTESTEKDRETKGLVWETQSYCWASRVSVFRWVTDVWLGSSYCSAFLCNSLGCSFFADFDFSLNCFYGIRVPSHRPFSCIFCIFALVYLSFLSQDFFVTSALSMYLCVIPALRYRRITGPELLCVTCPNPDPPSLPDAVPPPVTAVAGVPKVTGSDGSEPRYCE